MFISSDLLKFSNLSLAYNDLILFITTSSRLSLFKSCTETQLQFLHILSGRDKFTTSPCFWVGESHRLPYFFLWQPFLYFLHLIQYWQGADFLRSYSKYQILCYPLPPMLMMMSLPWNGSTVYNPVLKQMMIRMLLTSIISSSALLSTMKIAPKELDLAI